MAERGRNTKQRLIQAARHLFARHGFEGVSIASIAEELGVTKQALLHHFSRKENLYGEVLDDLSQRLMALAARLKAEDIPATDRYKRITEALFDHFTREDADSRLILRELLDNEARAERSRKWYLREFLNALTDLAATDPVWANAPRPTVFAGVYQAIAASNYFAVSTHTLKGICGPEDYRRIADAYPETLARSGRDKP